MRQNICVQFSSSTHSLRGYSITAAELAAQVREFVASSAATGWANLGAIIGGLKGTDLRWAHPLELKNAVEAEFLERFGEKVAAAPKGKVCRVTRTWGRTSVLILS